MMNSADRLNEIRNKVPENVKIIAVSKTKPASMIELLYRETGQMLFGENKVQELESKHAILPDDINWHFIGHLQTNKIRYIAPYIALIQSVDSFKLIREINKEGIKNNRVIPCLLQFHIAREEAKYGFSFEEATQMLESNLLNELSNISIQGVMGMATFTDDKHQIRKEFKSLFNYFNLIKSEFFAQNPGFCEVSMGMTDDYQLAIEEGSTIIRIGSGIFGER
jgi:pyridoxal phosphate enzyme (YggS family)